MLARPRHRNQRPAFLGMSETEPSLSAQLRAIVAGDEEISLGTVLDQVGERGFGLLLLLLSLPSALPVPAPGYSVPFGIALAILAVQLIRGRTLPWFPKNIRRTVLPRKLMVTALGNGARFFRLLESLVRPRLRWITSRGGRVFIGAIVLTMAGLMMVPIPGTNTFPAFVVFLLGVALTEEDGLFGMGALVMGLGAVALYVGLIIAMIIYGPEVVTQLKDWIMAQFGG